MVIGSAAADFKSPTFSIRITPGDIILNNPGTFFSKLAISSALLLFSMSTGAAWAGDCHTEAQQFQEGKSILSCEQKPNGHKWMKAKILIHATPHVVWETVHEERQKDPDLAYSKVLSENKNHKTIEQKFALIPVLGTAVCVMRNIEVPYERIDYDMISSDRFKAVEGSWVLTPTHDGSGTYLELATYLDIGMPVPRPMMEGITAKKLQKRLANVKRMAETAQIKVAQSEHKPE